MFEVLKILVLIICVVGIIYIVLVKNKYKNDKTSLSKENIIKYFQDNNITSLEKGVKPKDLPKEIVKNPYLLMMVQDKTLTFQKGKYYLKWDKDCQKEKDNSRSL